MKALFICWLFLLPVAVATPPSQSWHTTYLIRPNTSTPCPPSTADKCLTLQEFAEEEEPEGNTTTDITLELMSGVHNLSTNVVVESIQSFSMHPLFYDSEVEVTCSTSVGLIFRDVSKTLSVKQISYSYCGVDLDVAAIQIESAFYVQISQVNITHSPGLAMVVSNVSSVNVDSTVIRDSYATGLNISDSTVVFTGNNTFMYNSGGGALAAFSCHLYFNGQTVFEYNTAYLGGGMILYNSMVELSGWVTFVNNTATGWGGAIFMLYGSMTISGMAQFSRNTAKFGGGAIAVNNTDSFDISGNATFARNHALYGGGALMISQVETVQLSGKFCRNSASLFEAGSGGAIYIFNTTSVQVVGSTVFDGNAAKYGGAVYGLSVRTLNLTGNFVYSGNVATFGSVLFVALVVSLDLSGSTLIERNRACATITIYNSSTVVIRGEHTFQSNVGDEGSAGMYLVNVLHIKFDGRTTFLSNHGKYGALWMSKVSAELNGNLTLVGNSAQLGGAMILNDTNFTSRGSSAILLIVNNHASTQGGAIFLYQSMLSIQSGAFVAESNSAGDSGGAVSLSYSSIALNATMTFVNNSAVCGGAYYQTGESRLTLGNKAYVLFLDNRAEKKGGAIYAVTEYTCNVNVLSRCFLHIQDKRMIGMYITFKNNHADVAGNVVYGGWIEECIFQANGGAEQYNIHNISYISSGIGANNLTTIASDPYKVCPCMNGTLQCSTKSIVLPPIYPGQAFIIAVATVGQEHGTVPSTVEVSFGLGSTAIVASGQRSQSTLGTCTNLTYRIHSLNKTENISLSAAQKCQQLELQIDFVECPKGFELSGSPAQCVCQERLLEYTQKCTIDDQKIHRTSDFWLGYDNATRGLILHSHCPFDYCTPPPNNFTIEHSDLQCSYNRMRLLCGQCQPGFSLALGTSRCLRCSDYYLALLPVFAVAGLALVIFLFIFRLTLASGTINGLIFYANLVHSNRILFFPTGQSNIVAVFISWLNLDLGLETCFYKGMDTYALMWLQFAFPLYVWVLCGCIVFISSKSYRMSRVLGTNPVAVLVTLFLLSYTKLLHTAFSALSFTTLSYPQHNTKLVWLYDANIQYLHGKHIPLFVVGLATLLLCLPYALLLLTSHWLRACSNHCLFRWVNSHRLKFLLDAHNAPFKTKHCYWTGLLLLTRLMLYFVYAVNVLGNGNIDLLATCIAVAALSVWMAVFEQPYKSRLLGGIEALFLLNVLILFVSTLYIRSAQGSQAALSYTSTILSLTVFVAILLFHGYLRIKHSKIKGKSLSSLMSNSTVRSEDSTNEPSVMSRHVTCSEIVLPKNRARKSLDTHGMANRPQLEMGDPSLRPILSDSSYNENDCDTYFDDQSWAHASTTDYTQFRESLLESNI